ncbi:hypothetical protein V3W47_04285 [Deinococcus sp. YIM 134068]|uniref:hypothetical protein n=1 Tax=Deinococcus lichenicola TaxID=3118910 RepID=UPI002F94A665
MRASHAVYYGPGTPEAVRVLGGFGTVVVQSGLYRPADLRALREGGTHVLGYLSMGEDHPLGDQACVPGSAPYHRGVNPYWGSVAVDAAHPGWREVLLARAGDALTHTDGLLLDTLCSAEAEATLSRIRDVRETWPGAWLLANRGFTLWPDLAPLVDGVLIEAFGTTHAPRYAPHDAGGLAYTAHWLAVCRAAGREVLALDYADTPALADLARTHAAAANVPTFVTDRALSLPGGLPHVPLDVPSPPLSHCPPARRVGR